MEESGDSQGDFLKFLEDGETNHEELYAVLLNTKTDFKPIPGIDLDRDETEYYQLQQTLDCNLVYPGIFVGDEGAARSKWYLKTIGITHVLNAAEGKHFGYVHTNEKYYEDTNIKYLGLPLADVPSVDISKYFYTSADFIEDALKNGGNVLVHCKMGISRSATCVLAYLMIKKNMLAVDAIRTVRINRDIRPNYGFLRQLAGLDNYLRRQRL
ncbi:dual specificity protein phosphatase 3 isoform X2 [Cephus cinctus]|uniref:Dual specificity protein phosphatase n=1 Tax=Cephus cinctus TaxID=211228 RepID=A0AAJ7FDD3_CEPCN|nr:dual specificity protein phosphatase 3 isoform X2 [Cephus cinctus]